MICRPRHRRRSVRSLHGIWDFAWLGDVNVDDVNVNDIVFHDLLAVPGCFDATPRYAGRRGVVAYRCDISVTPDRPHQLHFGSVQFWSRVHVDGQLLAEQTVGYAPFHVTFTPSQSVCRVVVLVDNRFHHRNHLQFSGYDWYQFGGIDGEVTLHELGNTWIEHVRVQMVDAMTGRLIVRLRTGGDSGCRASLVIHCGEQRLYAGPVRDAIEVQLRDAALWWPQRPALHSMHVELDEDDWIEHFGLRDIRTGAEQLLLNGKPIRLCGVNYHCSHPHGGSAVSDHALICDLQLIRDMNCNFIRVAHYPPAHRLLELCDEMGLLVWAESLGWGLREAELQHPEVAKAALANLDALVTNVGSHPCVIITGYFNECASDAPGARAVFERMAARLRQLLPDRLISYATNKATTDHCLDLVDVVAWNTYPGWYHGSLETMAEELEHGLETLRSRPGAAGKPVMISEIGAEALQGHRDWYDDRWSERYQVRMLQRAWQVAMHGSRPLSGFVVWQFCDTRTSTEPRMMMGRPRGFNNKGVVDDQRVPKLAYDMLQRKYHSLAASEHGR